MKKCDDVEITNSHLTFYTFDDFSCILINCEKDGIFTPHSLFTTNVMFSPIFEKHTIGLVSIFK
jgi:hypothetical protein